MTTETDVRMLAEGCPVGQTRANVVCPYCGGGRTKERTFSVTRDCHGILYNCYRASCGARGFLRDAGAAMVLKERNPSNLSLRPYHGYTLPLGDKDFDFFRERFNLDKALVIGNVWLSEKGEYVLPVRGPDRQVSAYMVRYDSWVKPGKIEPPAARPRPDGRAKSYTYKEKDRPVQSFYRGHWQPSSPLVIVEDQLSAMRVAQDGHDAVALMGTTMNADRAREIASLQPTEVVIALDADATDKAFEMAREWGLAFNKTRVAILEQDIKDMDRYEVLPALGVTT